MYTETADGAAERALRQKFTEPPLKIAIGVAAAVNAVALTAGRYRVSTSATCYILQGPSGIEATLAAIANGHLMPEGVVDYLEVDGATTAFVAVISDAAGGYLELMRQ